jgi:peptidoglycan/xylan/chitin deacetylase (PgdA/CDA1 family)
MAVLCFTTSAFGWLIFAVSHEAALAQTKHIENTPAESIIDSNIVGLISSTRIEAKKQRRVSNATPTSVTHEPLLFAKTLVQLEVPILIYHKTPVDFEAQLQVISNKGYTTITMRRLSRILRGLEEPPAKPLVITFDDGFSDQLQAVDLLKRYQINGTFYIMAGGELSQGCLGAARNRTDCGDSYLNWDEIKEIAKSPFVEIGSHTLDHADLPALSSQEQRSQLSQNKKVIEQMLGREVTTLAYPYGHYTPEVMQAARDIGYTSAVSTRGGTLQSTAELFELRRIRDPYLLP